MSAAVLVPALVLLLQAQTQGEDLAARRFAEAQRLFDAERFVEAAHLFRAVHAETADPVVLYPAAQSFRLGGHCPEALAAYEEFLRAEEPLRRRAEEAPPGAPVKRLPTDLAYARARVIEMRVCIARPQSEPARRVALQRVDAGDRPAALAMLRTAWDETRDPTLLPDLAELGRGLGACENARRDLTRALEELTPVEVVREAGAPGSPLDVALDALRRARASQLDFGCVAPAAPPVAPTKVALVEPAPKPGPAPGIADAAAGPSRPRWPLWVAAGGGALVLGGGAALLAARAEQQALDRGDYDETSLDERLKWGERYNTAGVALLATGAAVSTASLVYYFLTGEPDKGGAPVVQLRPGGASLAWGRRF